MNARLRSLLLPAVMTLIALAMLVSLGNWQLRRLAWKEGLIARVEERQTAALIDLRVESLRDIGEPSSFLEANEYRPALLEGEYAAAGEVLVFTSLSEPKGAFGGPGYWVFTPLVTLPDGAIVYVNRGFVPEERKAAYEPPSPGRVTVKGAVRAVETGSWLTPEPDLLRRIFFARDPQRIAAATGTGGDVAGFFIDLAASGTPPSGLPQAGETRTMFPNNHLGYAVTWYGLAAALLAVFVSFALTRLRSETGEPRLTPPGAPP